MGEPVSTAKELDRMFDRHQKNETFPDDLTDVRNYQAAGRPVKKKIDSQLYTLEKTNS